MVKKDKTSKAAEQKARAAAKKSKKEAHKDKKTKSKGNYDDSDVEDMDVESVLEEYAKQQALFLKVTEVVCGLPSPRASSTLIGSPSNQNELFLFGGEFFDGALATFYNDLFIYLVDRDEWRQVTSPNSPLPRSGHAWCRGGNSGGVYLFGGEFSSPKQGTFYHYNDFWHLEPATREWTRLETKGKGPPPRSGHRMTYYKNYILLFGGFQDTSQQTRYLSDLWIYSCSDYTWYSPVLPPATQKPDPRSSFSFLPHEAGAVLYGGYSRVKAAIAAGKQPKGGNQGVRSVLKPIIHQDSWFLRIGQPSTDVALGTPPSVHWERRRKPTNPPNPPRAGATMAYHKGRGILFGGVHDVEASEERIDSEFFEDLFAWNIERNRYFRLTLRRPRVTNKKQSAMERGNMKRGKGKAGEEELLRNLAALEDTTGMVSDAMDVAIPSETIEEPARPEKQILRTMPHPRFNAQLAMQDDVLYIFGGTYEHGEREYTFDEMYAVDLCRLDGVKEIYRRELENWQESEDDSTEEEGEGEEEEDDDSEGEGSKGVLLPRDQENALSTATVESASENPEQEGTSHSQSITEDPRPHPRPFESLRNFFIRTSDEWQAIVLEPIQKENAGLSNTVKELRKVAFELAEIKWWDCREDITALEDQQEEAGIGEIMSIKDRVLEIGGADRKR